jgi:hypothetical protein
MVSPHVGTNFVIFFSTFSDAFPALAHPAPFYHHPLQTTARPLPKDSSSMELAGQKEPLALKRFTSVYIIYFPQTGTSLTYLDPGSGALNSTRLRATLLRHRKAARTFQTSTGANSNLHPKRESRHRRLDAWSKKASNLSYFHMLPGIGVREGGSGGSGDPPSDLKPVGLWKYREALKMLAEAFRSSFKPSKAP